MKDFAALRTTPSRRLNLYQARATPTHPPSAFCWHANNQSVWLNATRDYGTGRHHRISADPHPSANHAAGPERCTALNASLYEPRGPAAITSGYRRQQHPRTARKRVIGEADTGADENIVADLDAVPNHYLVLHGYPVSEAGAGFNERMVANVAISPDDSPFHDMRKGPYSCTGSNLLALAKRKAMHKDFGRGSHGAYTIGALTGTTTLSRAMLCAAASIKFTTRHPLTPSERGLFPEIMQSKKWSTSASSGSLV